MKYRKIVKATFITRPNRFVAKVLINDKEEVVHVKNTGRCRELLIRGVDVILEESDNPNRKTRYDLVSVYKENLGWVNIDSQAPNKIVHEWLSTCGYDYIKPEYVYGDSRIDFYMERGEERYLMEVKGCTLEVDGIGYFPDAPTERGVKHLNELARACGEDYKASLTYVIQMNGISEVRPNVTMHREYGEAIRRAVEAGVEVNFLLCYVTEDEVIWREVVKEK